MFSAYISDLDRLYRSGNATEHSYRPALKTCLDQCLRDVDVTNEPKRQACGAPDYILARKGIPIGYVEAKDVGIGLDRVERDEQLKRYLHSLDNLILTDYVEFRFYLRGQKVDTVAIGTVTKSGIAPLPGNFTRLAALMREVFFRTVTSEPEGGNSLKAQLEGFQKVLMHDMDAAQFAERLISQLYRTFKTYTLLHSSIVD